MRSSNVASSGSMILAACRFGAELDPHAGRRGTGFGVSRLEGSFGCLADFGGSAAGTVVCRTRAVSVDVRGRVRGAFFVTGVFRSS